LEEANAEVLRLIAGGSGAVAAARAKTVEVRILERVFMWILLKYGLDVGCARGGLGHVLKV
jgi:hypothetical protein